MFNLEDFLLSTFMIVCGGLFLGLSIGCLLIFGGWMPIVQICLSLGMIGIMVRQTVIAVEGH